MKKIPNKTKNTIFNLNLRKLSVLLFVLFLGLKTLAQVGIGTTTPDETAILELKSTERGLLFPRMSSNNRTSIASPATGLHVFDTDTNSAWFYDGSNWINYATQSKYGDVKSGIQSADHDGWVLLDGRALSSLSAAQQNVATSLGLSGNLPDATDAYLVQNGGAMASVTGTNSTTLTQSNLPSVTFTGNTNNTGSHSHSGSTSINGSHSHSGSANSAGAHSHTVGQTTIRRRASDADGGNNNFDQGSGTIRQTLTIPPSPNTSTSGSHTHTLSINANGNHNHSLDINSSGNHSHTVTVNSGGTSEPIAIKPKSLSVNMFVYLGL